MNKINLLAVLILGTLIFTCILFRIILGLGKYSLEKVLYLIWAYISLTAAYAGIYMFIMELDPLSFVIEAQNHSGNFGDELIFWLHYSVLVIADTHIAGVRPAGSIVMVFVILEIFTKLLFGFLVVNTFLKKGSGKEGGGPH